MSTFENLKKLFEEIRDEHRKNSNTAERIGNAFLSLLSFFNINTDKFLRKDIEDTAQKKITFLDGAHFGKNGGSIDKDGNAAFMIAVISELMRSVRFVDGINGEGWQLWIDSLSGLSNLTIDKVTIRQTLVAMEYLIEKVRSTNGQIVVSAANGKIKDVRKNDDYVYITFEQGNEFEEHDLIRCAEFTGTQRHEYWVEISAVDGDVVVIPLTEFGGIEPNIGDECVLMGNTQNCLRQNLISIAATEDGQPRIDVLDKVSAKHFNGCLRVRIGCLDGISDSSFPANKQPQGYGLYGDNVYLKGTFLLETGEDILTKFSITEGKIESAVESLRKDLSEEKSYLANSSFSDGLSKWETEASALLFMRAGKWLLANGAPLAKKSDYATVKTDSGRTTLYINNKFVLQKNENFRYHPEFEENEEGLKKVEPVYISFFYRVAKKGVLTISFENIDKSGFEDFDPYGYSSEMDVTDGYQTFNTSLIWNGTGDFKLSFTGEIYIYMLVLSTDRADALAYRYRTLFEQSDTLVKIVAENFDKDGNVIESSSIITNAKYNHLMSKYFDEDGRLLQTAGLVTTAEMNKLYAFDANGNLVSMIEQTAADIKISAKNISLEGLVTANDNFKILEDGSIEANGNFVSKDDKYGNSIIINASSGSFKMIGPSAVDAGDLPADDNRKDLYALEFLTDSESSQRYASIKLWGGDILTINPYNGFYLVNPLGKAYCHLTKESLEFRNEDGEYAVFDITGYHK
ncbi:hypothetical protein [Prevotella sp. HCN-7019]|uniref:hypothetical protein n=1 Tax=Prevotella sp. HCN-7019 TaxID=3134668 RepID=UPI0030BB4DEC